MKLVGALSTAVLSLSLGIGIPAYAQQEQHDRQEENKDKPAQEKEKSTTGDNSPSRTRKTRGRKRRVLGQKRRTRRNNTPNNPGLSRRKNMQAAAAFLQTVTGPISDGNIAFASAKANTAIAASNTVAIRSDSLSAGRATGSTRKTFMLSRSMACTTCAMRAIRA